MNRTKIPYLDYTWNPIAMRCTPCSPGCDHCWHLRMADRMKANPKFSQDVREAYAGGPPVFKERNHLEKIKSPSRIGLQYMGDWMHKDIKTQWIDNILEVVSIYPQHTFFTLTKRPENLEEKIYGITIDHPLRQLGGGDYLPNLWLGVTVCNQEEADDKIPILLSIPGFKKWISYEPTLGAVDFEKIELPDPYLKMNGITGCLQPLTEKNTEPDDYKYFTKKYYKLSWIIAGAESGPGARPADNDWFRLIRDQCRAAGVPFFIKQATGPIPEDLMIREYPE